MAVDAPDAQLESQPSQAAGTAAVQGGKRASESQLSKSRKRSAPAAQPETVPEQKERTKRRKRSPAAKPDAAAAMNGSPPEVNGQGNGSKKPAAVSQAADAAEDDAAAVPEPGNVAAVVPRLHLALPTDMRVCSLVLHGQCAFEMLAPQPWHGEVMRRWRTLLQAAVVPHAVAPSLRPSG